MTSRKIKLAIFDEKKKGTKHFFNNYPASSIAKDDVSIINRNRPG